MELSKTIATVAVVLAVVLAAAYAVGEEVEPAPKVLTAQQKVDQREAQRRVSLEEQQKRKEHFERSCNKPLKTSIDYDLCRAAYKALVDTQK